MIVVFCSVRLKYVTLNVAHIYVQLFKDKFPATFSLPMLAIIVNNEK